jgi:drug/metabolite transporter (DMT)-like permease
VAVTGLVLFNVAIVRGVAHAEPAVIAVAVAAVPLVLAVAGPLAARARPAPVVVAGAGIVSAGAALVAGAGRTDLTGVGWAAVVLACEVAFTLLAVPVLGRLGPWGVSLHAVWIAAAALAVLGVVVEGPTAVTTLDAADLLAAVHLAVVVTALAFLLWYTAVSRLGADRAGLFTGVAPVAAAAGGVLLGGHVPAPAVWAGIGLVAAGLAVGLRRRDGDAPVRVPQVGAAADPGAEKLVSRHGQGDPFGAGAARARRAADVVRRREGDRPHRRRLPALRRGEPVLPAVHRGGRRDL